MKKAFYGPYYRFLMNRMYSKKIIGRGTKEEINALSKIVASTISKVDSKRTEEEVFRDLSKRLKITFTEQLPAFSMAKGASSFNTIYIDKEDYDKTVACKPDELIDNLSYNIIVHESIHKLQGSKRFYRVTSIIGFIEGATDLFTLRANCKERSHDSHNGKIQYNFPATDYNNLVSIVSQLEVMFGKESTEDFALRSDMTLMKKTEELLGKSEFRDLGRDLARDARGKEPGTPIMHWQNILMLRYFNNKMISINSKEEAEAFLEQLKELEKARMKVKGDNTYEKFYTSKLATLKEKYPDLDIDKYAYKEAEFYPKIYFDEEIRKMDGRTIDSITTPETLDEFQELDLSQYKRYRFIKDKTIYETIVRDGKDVMFQHIDENNKLTSFWINDRFKTPKEKESGLSISLQDGKVVLSVHPPIGQYSIENQELEEIPLNVSKKDIYEKMLESEKADRVTATLGEKIARIFRRQKKLPPYSEVIQHEEKPEEREVSETKPSWELTEEQKRKANSIEVKPANQEKTNPELASKDKKEFDGEEY